MEKLPKSPARLVVEIFFAQLLALAAIAIGVAVILGWIGFLLCH